MYFYISYKLQLSRNFIKSFLSTDHPEADERLRAVRHPDGDRQASELPHLHRRQKTARSFGHDQTGDS